MKDSKNIIFIVLIVVVLGVAGYFIFKPKKEGNTEGEGENNLKDNTGDVKPPNFPTNPNPLPTNPTSNTTTKCGYMKYKRDSDDVVFKLLNDDELYKNGDSFVNKMRADGHSDDYISFAGAFLKGMDLALKTDYVRKYAAEIKDFKAKADIRRDGNFRNELQQQVYDVGTLVCESNMLVRLGLVNRNVFKK